MNSNYMAVIEHKNQHVKRQLAGFNVAMSSVIKNLSCYTCSIIKAQVTPPQKTANVEWAYFTVLDMQNNLQYFTRSNNYSITVKNEYTTIAKNETSIWPDRNNDEQMFNS